MAKKEQGQIYAERAAAREITLSRAANPLKLQDGDVNQYLPRMLKKLPESDLRKEYSRLRAIAHKRLKRMEGTQWEETIAYQTHKDGFLSLDQIQDNTELIFQLHDIARFVSAKSSSIKGNELMMYKTLATLHKNGYTFVNPKNFLQFGQFMEIYRQSNIAALFSSDEWVELYYDLSDEGDAATQRRISDIQKAFANFQQAQSALLIGGKKAQSIADLKDAAQADGFDRSIMGVYSYLQKQKKK